MVIATRIPTASRSKPSGSPGTARSSTCIRTASDARPRSRPVYNVFAWLESSGLGRLMRHTGPWTYAIVNLSHVLGVASLFGSVLVLDLRLLGVWRRVPLGPLADAVVPVAATGLALAATTGVALFATKTTEYFGNPFLLIK